jgi:hypothetical protein
MISFRSETIVLNSVAHATSFTQVANNIFVVPLNSI